MRREICGSCGSSDLEVFLDLGMSPVADAYVQYAHEYSQMFPLELAVCGKCRLAQLLEVLDDTTLFGTGYSFYSSASKPLSEYHKGYAEFVMSSYVRLRDKLIVEIGSNDGDMLQHFHEAGWNTLGVDPAVGPTEVARSRGINVTNKPFDFLRAQTIGEGVAGIVIANHVLAHVPDVFDFLSGVHHILAPEGVAFVEVQYVADLLTNNAFDLVYHEHRNFFSLTSLEIAATRAGLRVMWAELTNRQGGSLRVILTRMNSTSPRVYPNENVDVIRERERWLNDARSYAGVQGRVERIRTRLLDDLEIRFNQSGHTLAGYGAPAKATTLLNFCGISSYWLDHVVDSTPAKQGRYIPGTGIPIRSDENAAQPGDIVDAYLLLAWNYAPQIMRAHSSYDGNWIIPIPAPVVF